jgi:hypothetical protein
MSLNKWLLSLNEDRRTQRMQNTFAHESGYFGLHDSTGALEGSFRNVAD